MRSFILKISFSLTLLSCGGSHDKRSLNKSEDSISTEKYRSINNDEDSTNTETSVIIYFSKKEQVELTLSMISQRQDTLRIILNDSLLRYELIILTTKNYLTTQLKQTYSIADSSYRAPIFSIIEQNIKLNKTVVIPGDRLKGFINLRFSIFHHWEANYTDTIIVKGHLYAMID